MKKTARLLFVDDDVDLLAAMKLGLRKSPFEVFTAASADEAAAVLRTEAIDVVVSDERMPEVAGSRFLGLVRRNFPNTVRIALTGQASLEAVKRAVNEGGISRLLTKPCGAAEGAAAIDECLVVRRLAVNAILRPRVDAP